MARNPIRRRLAWIAVLALLVAWSGLPLARGAGAQETITVGSILDATGPINVYGVPMIDATRLAIDDINANGGVLGKQLELVEYDAQSDNAKYSEFANQLILKDKAAVIMGGITSASREAIRPLMDRNNQLYFYNEQYEGGVCDKLVVATGVVPEQQISTLLPWAVENYGPKIYTIAADYNYGQISADWVKVYAAENGAEVVGEEFIPLDVTDFSSTLSKIQEEQPDVVLSLLVGGNHIAFYRQWAAAGLKETYPVVSPTFGLGNEHVTLTPEEGEGIVVSYPYYQELDNPTNQAFVEMWHERYGADYPYITDSASVVWTGWHLWAMAVEKAGSLETDAVIAALESGLEFDAPEGKVTLDPQSHHLVHNVHIAKVNANQGFDILESFEGVAPTWNQEVCNLIEDPDTQEQFTPEEQ
jgi:branched-chain amino acid transport system substrate-binding protein